MYKCCKKIIQLKNVIRQQIRAPFPVVVWQSETRSDALLTGQLLFKATSFLLRRFLNNLQCFHCFCKTEVKYVHSLS